MLNTVGSPHRPRTSRAADLEFARPSQTKLRQLAWLELRRGQQEWHSAGVVLDPEEMVPSLDEVPGEITGRLPDYLHRDVMPDLWMSDGRSICLASCVPWHPSNLASIIHVFKWLIEGMEVPDTGIAIVLA